MTLHQLVLFVAVAEARSVSLASVKFCISQPAVTRQLRQLAEEYGTRLYTTTGRGVELTTEGERFLQHARNVLAAVTQLEGECRSSQRASGEELWIGACFPASASVIPPVISAFKKSFPDTHVNLTIDCTGVLLQSVLGGKLDLAVVLSLPAEPASVKHEIVSHYTPVLVGPPDHVLARKSRVTPRDLSGLPLILQKDGSIRDELLDRLKRAGIEPRIEMECLNAEGIKTAIKAGVGFGFLCEEHILPEVQSGLLTPMSLEFLDTTSMPCYSVCAANKPIGRALQGFFDLLYTCGTNRAVSASPHARKLPPA